ncbi:hypothetical protein M3Y94_00018100 [Aphelenchoides besseyi]|nr:hypothetical protein M3Y94_00018100 [Aphelenchoides besseyi]KAI6217091.1 hypothetical protein M3Y95_01240200 [Aphelenchoides besseyi]
MDENRSVVDELIDEDGITIFSAFEHMFLVVNTMVFGLSVYVITWGSTREMGVYRWFLLNEVVWSFLFDLSASVFQPVFMFPGPTCGLVSSIFFRRSNSDVARVLLLFFCMTFIGKTHAFASALVHRFACAFPDYSRVNRVYRFVTPWLHIFILLLPFAFILSFVVPFMVADNRKYRDRIIEVAPVMKEVYKYETAVACVLSSENSRMVGVPAVAVSFFTFLFLVYGFLFLYTRHLLQQRRKLFIFSQTLKLQQTLLRACALQVLGNVVFLFIPLLGFIWFLAARPIHSLVYITTAYLMLSLNSIFNYMCLIGFIRPYREITVNKTRQLFSHLFCITHLDSTRNVTIIQSCQTSL